MTCGEVAAAGPTPVVAEPPRAAPAQTAIAAGAASPSPSELAKTIAALRTENAALREQLQHFQVEHERQRADLQAEQGTPQTAPANLAPRFTSEALLANLTQALREAGLKDATITSIDCLEYPCIVYGDGMNAREDTGKLEGAPSCAPYAKDLINSFGWSADASGSRAGSHWGLALFPADDSTSPEDMGKRLRYRSSQMFESFRAKP